MKIPRFLTSRLPTRRGRPDRPMIVAYLMFLTGVLLTIVWLDAIGSRGEEHWALTALGAVSGLLLAGGCSVYLVTRIVRGVRRLRGEREPEPPPVPESAVLAAPRHRGRNFFLWLIGVPVAFVIFSVVFTLIVLGLASRRVESVRASIHPGMTAPQVLENASGWFTLSAHALPDRAEWGLRITSYYQGRYHVRSFAPEQSQSLTEAELLERIRQMAGGGEWKLAFTYTTTSPARYSFAVDFSADGKVKEVSPMRAWD